MVGKQAEFCFETYLKTSQKYTLLAATIQIQGATETIGELDYLVYDTKNNELLHIELTCKFYVYDDSNGTDIISHWIGPNRKDTLREKVTKLKEKQFPLLFKLETKKRLNLIGIETASVIQQVCFKAFLFIPKTLDKAALSKEYTDCIVGYWIRFSEFIFENETVRYAIPKKTEWLLSPESIREWVSFSEAKKHIKEQLENKKSPLVYKREDTTVDRFFVVWW